MSFVLQNTRATFQRCTQKCFREKISRNLEVCVDDIVVKSWAAAQLISDLKVTFSNLRANHIMLNLEKCMFGVPTGNLGFIISERGIEVSPKKISTIMDMDPVKNLKGA